MTNNLKSISHRVTKVSLISMMMVMLIFAIVFNIAVHLTENHGSVQRLSIVGTHYLHNLTGQEVVKAGPLITLYPDFYSLPESFSRRIAPEWIGTQTIHFEDDTEFAVYAEHIAVGDKVQVAYAIENTDLIEWTDEQFFIFSFGLIISGLIIFGVVGAFTYKATKAICLPLQQLSDELNNSTTNDFSPIQVEGKQSKELVDTLTALNLYRQRIKLLVEREAAFTRYVSHELRTPMTVIKGRLGLLKRLNKSAIDSQLMRISKALAQMEELTQTFLFLARGEQQVTTEVLLDQAFVEQAVVDLHNPLMNKSTALVVRVNEPVSLAAHEVLISAVIKNLTNNSLNYTVDGKVVVEVEANQLRVSDDGIGLEKSSNDMEGFGIGLQIVRDICAKYHWQFYIKNNSGKGCTATIKF